MSPVLFFRNNQTDLKTGAPLGGMYFPHETGVAYYSDNAFFASGINRGGNVQYALCAKPSLEALKKWVGKTFDDPNPQSSDYEPGTAYKRIHWPLAWAGSFHRAIDQNKLTESLVALRIRVRWRLCLRLSNLPRRISTLMASGYESYSCWRAWKSNPHARRSWKPTATRLINL